MSDVASKWGVPVAERGFAQVPNYLLLLNQFLSKEARLSPVELLVLMQLVGSWWRKDAMPFPSMSTLATRCGVSSRQIQRAVNRLEGAGLVQRVNRRNQGIISSNAYDLSPLVELLDQVAQAFPNEFPRKIDKAIVELISARVGPKGRSLNDRLADESFEPVKEPDAPPALPAPSARLRSRLDLPKVPAGQISEVTLDDATSPRRRPLTLKKRPVPT